MGFDASEHTIITDTATLAAFCERLSSASFITVDTEFMRESTFWAKLCLIQMAGPDEAAIIDPLAPGLDLAPFYALMANERGHQGLPRRAAGHRDLRQAGGRRAAPDLRYAGRRHGLRLWRPGELRPARLPHHRAGSSTRPPASPTGRAARSRAKQIAYAIADVTYLRDVYVSLAAQLAEQDRTTWVDEEMAVLSDIETYRTRPGRRLAAAEAAREEAAPARRPAGARRLARARGAGARRAARPRAEGRGDLRDRPAAAARRRGARAAPDHPARLRALERSRAASWRRSRRRWRCPTIELPRIPRQRAAPEHASAAAELLKVLLKMVAEEHGVAARIIASTDDLEQIAADDEADVPALQGLAAAAFRRAGAGAEARRPGAVDVAARRRRRSAFDRRARAIAAE